MARKTPPAPPPGVLARLRKICLALPGAAETSAWGHPNFKVKAKAFAAFEQYKGEWVIAFKTEPARQAFLVETDPRFYVSPYVGKHGWVSLRVGGKVRWKEVASFVRDSYRLVAPVLEA